VVQEEKDPVRRSTKHSIPFVPRLNKSVNIHPPGCYSQEWSFIKTHGNIYLSFTSQVR